MQISSKRLSGETALVLGTSIVVNAGNYLLNLLIAKHVGPEMYGPIVLLSNIVLALSFLGVGFQLTTAKLIAEGHGQQVLSRLKKHALYCGLAITGLLAGFSVYGSYTLNLDSTAIMFLSIGAPLYLLMSINRGVHQARQNFKALSLTYLSEMAFRFILTIAGMYFISGLNLQIILVLAYLISFAIPLMVKVKVDETHINLQQGRIRKELLGISSYELSQIIINHSDIFLVQLFIGGMEAGLYAAVSLVGKAIYFATWSVSNVMFPKIVQRRNEGLEYISLFLKNALFVLAVGLCIITAVSFKSDLIVEMLFGSGFTSAAAYLPLYAIISVLFSLVNVFAYFFLTSRVKWVVITALIIGVGQIAGIVLYHQTLLEVLVVQIVLMAIYLSMTMVMFIRSEREELRDYFSSNKRWKWRRYQSTISLMGKEAAA